MPSYAGTATGAAPAYVKVARAGTTYTAYTSSDGVNWTLIPSSSRTMSNLSGTVQMGLAVTSHSAGALSTATFDQIAPNPTVPGTVTISAPSVPSGITSYPIQTAYNDANMPTSLTYSDNEVASYGYDGASGWLTSLSTTPSGGSATTLLGNIGYSGAGGAAGHATGADVAGGAGGTYSYSASYDANVRLTSLTLTKVSGGTVLFRSQRGYDALGNVTAVNTTLADGTDNQAFCYDEQNRLVWAGSTGTPSCGASLTPGSLTAANYTQTFGYDTLDRLINGPLGSYTYGDAAHLHAATSIGSGYTAKYDALGDMTCRAPTSTTTCAGTPTGAMLGYDNEGRLATWQDKPSSPTTTDAFLYDGAGQRVAQQVTVGGSITTTTVYVGGMEEIMTTSSGSTLTKYFGAPGLPTTMRVGTSGPLSYLASDGLGSVSEALDSSGGVTSEQLYSPYGTARYTTGFSPTSLGYTGQRADASTGLDYYQARYYDPVAGQFASADNVADGLNRYGYVAGNPETLTDPSGHSQIHPQGGDKKDYNRYPKYGFPLSDNVQLPTDSFLQQEQRQQLRQQAAAIARQQTRGPGTYPTAGGGVFTASSYNYGQPVSYTEPGLIRESTQSDKRQKPPNAARTDGHVENKVIQDAIDFIRAWREKHPDLEFGATYDINIIATLPPCEEALGCQDRIITHTWLNQLLAAAGEGTGAFVRLYVWQIIPDPDNETGSSVLKLVGSDGGQTSYGLTPDGIGEIVHSYFKP